MFFTSISELHKVSVSMNGGGATQRRQEREASPPGLHHHQLVEQKAMVPVLD